MSFLKTPEQFNKPPRFKLVYILAASHSGSTLLAMLLGSHPEVCTVGELKFTSLGDIDLYRCSCKNKIKECLFWNGIREDMNKYGLTFDFERPETHFNSITSQYIKRLLRPLHRGPLLEKMRDMALSVSSQWRYHFPRVQKQNEFLVKCLLSRTGKKVVVDSSKIGIRLKFLLKNPALDVKVIRLIRDGRAVALTYMDPARFADAKDASLQGGGAGNNRESERLSMTDAAYEWRRSNEEAEKLLLNLDQSNWIEVRYEELCLNTDRELKKIYSFLGIENGRVYRDFRSQNHHVVGNGMRLDSTNEIKLDERWKTALSTLDLKQFYDVAGNMNQRLGYHYSVEEKL